MGHGSIARWLAERVAPTGSVIAADIDPRFLTNMPAGVDVRRFDIRQDDLEADTYDLVHCRALLMHLPDPTAALARMVAALRPGGLFLIEEGDYGLWSYSGPADAPRLNKLVTDALTKLAAAKIADPWFGRTLPGLLSATGLQLHGSEVETRVARPGEADYEFEWAGLLATLPVLISLGIYGEADANLIQTLTGHVDSVITTASLVAVWGQKHRDHGRGSLPLTDPLFELRGRVAVRCRDRSQVHPRAWPSSPRRDLSNQGRTA